MALTFFYRYLTSLKTTTSGSGTAAVTTTDSWNIQGWLTARSAMKGSTNIFSMSLGYYSPVQSGATARYSGDISSWAWTQYEQPAKAYAFTYDGAHRLTAGQYYSGGSATNALSEKGISYDRAGNITALSRYNNSGAATSLAYSYTGNRRNNYSYDVNGNVTSDATNNLQSSYNLLNLPAQIKSGSTVKANDSYLSDGTKAKALNASSAGYDYAGSFTYSHASNGTKTLESIAFGGGRIRRTGNNAYAVDYHITDHLGSVRAIVNASGSIVEQNDYYPFGTRHPNGLTQLSANRWRFSGKEEQDAAFGIAYSDFGTRLYDRSAAWTAMDPLAEKYYGYSPYLYCAGDPILIMDPEGTIWYIVNSSGGISEFSPVDEGFDRLFVEQRGEDNIKDIQEIIVHDKTILNSLKNNKIGIAKGAKTSSEEVSSLFYFLADNTYVEWVLYSIDEETMLLGTKRKERSSGDFREYGIRKPVSKIHSHPLVETDIYSELESMGKSWNARTKKFEKILPSDISNVSNDILFNGKKATASYVYFPKSKHTYVLRPDPKLLNEY